MFVPSIVTAPMAASAVHAVGCTGLQAVDPLCYAASAAGSIGGSVAAAGIGAVFDGLSQWVASGAEWLLSQIGNVLVSTTSIDLGADWFTTHYEVMTALAAIVVLPLLLVSTLQAVYRQNAGQLVRSFFVQLPLALLLGVVAVQIVILCLSATDALCTEVAGGSGSDVHALLTGMSKGLIVAVADPGMATFVLLLVGLLVAAASFVLWLELLVRAAAVYVAVLFLPLAMATLVWPTVAHWCRRLVETLTALILSKFVIVATLSLAAERGGIGHSRHGRRWRGFRLGVGGGRAAGARDIRPFLHSPAHSTGGSGCSGPPRRRAATCHGRAHPVADESGELRPEERTAGEWRRQVDGAGRPTRNGWSRSDGRFRRGRSGRSGRRGRRGHRFGGHRRG